MTLIDSERLKFFLNAAQTVRSVWEAACQYRRATDRRKRRTWSQAQPCAEQAFGVDSNKARDLTTVRQVDRPSRGFVRHGGSTESWLSSAGASRIELSGGFGAKLPSEHPYTAPLAFSLLPALPAPLHRPPFTPDPKDLQMSYTHHGSAHFILAASPLGILAGDLL